MLLIRYNQSVTNAVTIHTVQEMRMDTSLRRDNTAGTRVDVLQLIDTFASDAERAGSG